MTHNRMKWILLSEIILLAALIVLALAAPRARAWILPVVLLAGVVQMLAVTLSTKRQGRK